MVRNKLELWYNLTKGTGKAEHTVMIAKEKETSTQQKRI